MKRPNTKHWYFLENRVDKKSLEKLNEIEKEIKKNFAGVGNPARTEKART